MSIQTPTSILELGVMGDRHFDNTIQYWGSASALDAHAHFIGDVDNEWKLNWKHLDGDRADLHPGHFAVDDGERLVMLVEQQRTGLSPLPYRRDETVLRASPPTTPVMTSERARS
jgi:hypothetical protein